MKFLIEIHYPTLNGYRLEYPDEFIPSAVITDIKNMVFPVLLGFGGLDYEVTITGEMEINGKVNKSGVILNAAEISCPSGDKSLENKIKAFVRSFSNNIITNNIITSQMEQTYRTVYNLSTVLGTHNAFELLDKIKVEIESERKPNEFYGASIINELMSIISADKENSHEINE